MNIGVHAHDDSFWITQSTYASRCLALKLIKSFHRSTKNSDTMILLLHYTICSSISYTGLRSQCLGAEKKSSGKRKFLHCFGGIRQRTDLCTLIQFNPLIQKVPDFLLPEVCSLSDSWVLLGLLGTCKRTLCKPITFQKEYKFLSQCSAITSTNVRWLLKIWGKVCGIGLRFPSSSPARLPRTKQV